MSKLVAEREYTRAEFDWIAVDESGNIGFFASGGFGPVPQVSLAAADELLNIQEQIRALPWTCKTESVAQVAYYLGDFFEVAEKGVFAYNWDFDRREYRLIVRPVAPVAPVDSASARQVASLAQRVRLPLRFDCAEWVPPDIEIQEG